MVLSSERVAAGSATVVTAVADWHVAHPDAVGIAPSALSRQTGLPTRLLTEIVERLLLNNELVRDSYCLRRPAFSAQLSETLSQLVDTVYQHVSPEQLKPPALAALASAAGMERASLDTALDELVQLGYLVRISRNRVYHPAAINTLVQVVAELSAEHAPQGFDAASYRDRSQIGRNITIDVLEYFDRVGITRRLGDRRMLRNR